MKTKCPHCGQHYELDDSSVGMTATCEKCQKDFTVSAAPPEPPPKSVTVKLLQDISRWA